MYVGAGWRPPLPRGCLLRQHLRKGEQSRSGQGQLGGDLCYQLQMAGPSGAGPMTPENHQLGRRKVYTKKSTTV